MRLIIKDYLLQLKEKDELDLLLCDVLFQMGYITENRPKTGNRQHGVDIRAQNEDELLLCVVKQGNLTRQNWNSGQNAVRQSLDEIQDSYLGLITGKEREKKLHVVVATNGMIDEAVRTDWEGYRERNTMWSGMCVQIDFWNIDTLTDIVQKYLLDEHVFGAKMQGLMRRALYFVGDGDYHREYFEKIISSYFVLLKAEDSAKERKKKLASVFLASQMIAQYAAEVEKFKISIAVSEYLIIRFWKWMMDNEKFENQGCGEWLIKFLAEYKKWNHKYYVSVKYCCQGKNRVPAYNPVEQKVLLYEMVGHLTSYAYYLSFQNKHDKEAWKECNEVVNSIIELINNHPQFWYAPYDKDIGVISMLYRLLLRLNRAQDVSILIHNQTVQLVLYYRFYCKYPSPVDSFEDAVNIHMGFPAEEYVTSAFWGTMLKWLVLMEQKELYGELQPFLAEDLESVTKCVWFLRADEESALYDAYAMNMAGDGVAFEPNKSYEDLKEQITFVMDQYAGEMFSFEKYSFDTLEFIVSRYYGYLVRVKKEHPVG